MQEYILEILNEAEKQGILTGGSDDEGNFAFVVVDSSSNITITVRPRGRATLIVSGEPEDFDISEDLEAVIDFFSAIADALVEDNLDSKSDKLITIIEESEGPGEGDEEEDEESEDGEEGEEEELLEGDEEVTEDDAEEPDDTDEEYQDEEEDEEPDSEDDEEYEEEALSSDELALMIDHMPAIVDDMIETAAGKGKPTEFNVESFLKLLGGTGGEKHAVTYQAGASLGIKISKKVVTVSVWVGDGKPNGSTVEHTGTGAKGAGLVRFYIARLLLFAKLNKIDYSKYRTLFDAIADAIDNDKPVDEIRSACRSAATLLRTPLANIGMGDNKFLYSVGQIEYSIGYKLERDYYKVYLIAHGNGYIRTVFSIKADYMIAIGAALAKAATLMGQGSNYDAPISGGNTKRFSLKLMSLATKFGYAGETEAEVKMKTSSAIRETAGVETAAHLSVKSIKREAKSNEGVGLFYSLSNGGGFSVVYSKGKYTWYLDDEMPKELMLPGMSYGRQSEEIIQQLIDASGGTGRQSMELRGGNS